MSENTQYRPHRLKPFNELVFTDDFMFRKVLYGNEELCKELIELILDIEIDHIEYVDEDHDIKPMPEKRGVRLDVYVKDENNTVFDIEMQNLVREALPKRTRYYQSMIDIGHLKSGAKFGDLPDSYIIFICMFDPYERDFHKYEFRELCIQDTNIELGSGATKVFINAKSAEPDMSPEMKAFLDYLCGRGAASDLTKKIEDDVARIKANKPWEVEYMHWDEMIEESREEGISIGDTNRGYSDVDRVIESGWADAETACSKLKVDYEAYKAYKSAAAEKAVQ